MKVSNKLAGNGLGLAAVLAFITSSPELKPNKITDDEVKDKKLDRIPSDRTTADSEQKDEDLFVSQHRSKPHVSGSFSFHQSINFVSSNDNDC